MKKLIILGACGSIGTQVLDIVRKYPNDYQVLGMSVGRNLDLALELIREFKPEIVCFRQKEHILSLDYPCQILCEDEGLFSLAEAFPMEEVTVVNALVGSIGLMPTVKAIQAHHNIALANKETLVMAGDIINQLLKENNTKLYPIDSEHSAIWQCLNGEDHNDVKRLIITASGGSFRNLSRTELTNVTVEDALNHPNWQMGPKITIDSATMMNKGFEVIEAHHLFHLPIEQIDTIIHKESVIHSMVEYQDGNVKALLAVPDMRLPILYALSYPKHLPFVEERLDLAKISRLSFENMSFDRYPCLEMAYEAIKKGGLYPAVLNAANEAAVYLFLNHQISFLMIEKIVRQELDVCYPNNNPTLAEIIQINDLVREKILLRFGVEK